MGVASHASDDATTTGFLIKIKTSRIIRTKISGNIKAEYIAIFLAAIVY